MYDHHKKRCQLYATIYHYSSLLLLITTILNLLGCITSSFSPASNDSLLSRRLLEAMPPGGKRWIMKVGNGHFDTTCQFAGKPICCNVIDESQGYYPKRSRKAIVKHTFNHRFNNKCNNISVEYTPSPYETRHLAIAKEISMLPTETARRQALFDYIWKDIPDSNKWLRKLQKRGRSSNNTGYEESDDSEYLSRFRYTLHCHTNNKNPSQQHFYDEWIEPLTVHGRHPFAWLHCPKFTQKRIEYDNAGSVRWPDRNLTIQVEAGKEGIYDTTYILLANEDDVSMRSNFARVRRISTSFTPGSGRGGAPKQYLLDAGTSRFDSSLIWFACGYAQRGIAFDHLYGWEVNYFEQAEFWGRVPPSIVPIYSFYNHPVSEKERDGTSVVRLVKQAAREEDFISFKLDIDTTSVEMPIAMQLLNDPSFYNLIDEFFFELHFQCEIMMICGWERGAAVPESFEGFKLERYSVMTFFQDLRRRGVRAHTWV